MSLKNNKITRLNRYIMFGTLLLGVLVLGCVFAFLYLSFNPDSLITPSTEEAPVADSVIFVVSDSTFLEP